ncbi:Pentatricopeptide repeat-containing protein, chloroplastic [Ananas comosus]|uniref:Pentatricopeptide repeat-containing protein, chloroplastic n=1 Tax=Ananas comosus TaxID=4615 RepID=A0A199V4G5_ANACO|nr:Pentatricopeptide repeat-containing protein, chloroplastic [Ananas comosus]
MEKQKDIIRILIFFATCYGLIKRRGMLEKLANVYYWILKVGVDFDEAILRAKQKIQEHAIVSSKNAECGWIEEVAGVLKELKQRGLEPDLYGYNTLIKAYGIAGMAEEAVKIVQEMRRRKINPDRATYSNLITALQRNENFLEAVKWSLWMRQMGCPS